MVRLHNECHEDLDKSCISNAKLVPHAQNQMNHYKTKKFKLLNCKGSQQWI